MRDYENAKRLRNQLSRGRHNRQADFLLCAISIIEQKLHAPFITDRLGR
jgi:hypothetical protein